MPNPSPAPNEVTPETPLVPFTCEWAQDGLRKALEGMGGTSSGVRAYKIGTRSVEYHGVGEQGKAIDYWMKMVEYYCGVEGLPSALTGRDTAFRVVPRDV